MINWHPLTSEEQLSKIIEESKESPIAIFKHSTSCSISATAKSRLERQWAGKGLEHIKSYYLDLLSYRPVSNAVAEIFHVRHESPQLLLIKDGMCAFNASHLNIRVEDVKQHA